MVVTVIQAQSRRGLNHGIGDGNGGEERVSKDIKEIIWLPHSVHF